MSQPGPGKIIYLLCRMLCKANCNAKTVAASIAFQPPKPPFYDINIVKTKEGQNEALLDNEYQVELREDIHQLVNPIMKSGLIRREVHIVKSKRGTIPLFIFKVKKPKATIFYSHGNATDLGAMTPRFLEMCQNLSVDVCGYDYSGYGSSQGAQATEQQVYYDAKAAFEYLVNECNVPASQIILYGQSVGSGPSVYLATIYQCLGLVLHAGLLSGLRVLTPNRCCLCCCDIFPNVDRMPKVKCPTFIIHGIEDAQIHVSHGMGLYEKTPDKYKVDPWFVEGADHNNVVYTNFRPYFFKMKQFIDNLTSENGNKGKNDNDGTGGLHTGSVVPETGNTKV